MAKKVTGLFFVFVAIRVELSAFGPVVHSIAMYLELCSCALWCTRYLAERKGFHNAALFVTGQSRGRRRERGKLGLWLARRCCLVGSASRDQGAG